MSMVLQSGWRMFPPSYIDDAFSIETARLTLRWPRVADSLAIARLAGDRAVAGQTAAIPHPYPDGEAERFVFSARKANTLGGALALAITRADARLPDADVGSASLGSPSLPGTSPGGEFVGMVALDLTADTPQAVLSYWLGTPFQRQGYATEAVRALVDCAFENAPLQALLAGVRVVNPSSRRVLEKCGFRYEGSGLEMRPARGGVFPVDRFRLDRAIWTSLKAWRDPRVVIAPDTIVHDRQTGPVSAAYVQT